MKDEIGPYVAEVLAEFYIYGDCPDRIRELAVMSFEAGIAYEASKVDVKIERAFKAGYEAGKNMRR